MEREPESRSWIRQVPTPPSRSHRVPLTIFVYVPGGSVPREAWVINGRMSTICVGDLGQTYPHSPNREAGLCYGAKQEFFWARGYRQDLFWGDIW